MRRDGERRGLSVDISRFRFLLVCALVLFHTAAQAALGFAEIPGREGDGPVTVFYPSSGEAQPVKRGRFTLDLALDAAPARGNARLVVVSHGSGGSPWVFANLARALVEAGFFVAFPEHRGDNYKDPGTPGPESWKLRPAEVSRAIDAVGADARFAPLLSLDKVGMYGFSAGGHTALVIAGGAWSPARFRDHCESHIADDFHGCVGLASRLTGGVMDSVRKSVALAVIRSRFDDAKPYTHADPRIAAVVAAAPLAADFDLASLAKPRVPLALVTAGKDKWLPPRFHSDLVLRVCTTCERLADLPTGGHGAFLSPFPPGLTGLVGDLLNDPPGFDRKEVAEVERRVVGFFGRVLGR